MGELRVARGGTLRTFLGSCVGTAVHDPRRRVAGLAHVMLPAAQGRDGPPGKYAVTAVAELLRLLDVVVNPFDPPRLAAVFEKYAPAAGGR